MEAVRWILWRTMCRYFVPFFPPVIRSDLVRAFPLAHPPLYKHGRTSVWLWKGFIRRDTHSIQLQLGLSMNPNCIRVVKRKRYHHTLWWYLMKRLPVVEFPLPTRLLTDSSALISALWLIQWVTCSTNKVFTVVRLRTHPGWYLTPHWRFFPLFESAAPGYLLGERNIWNAYLVSVYWPALESALLICRGIAMWCLTTWSFLSGNGPGSTPPAPVLIHRTGGFTHSSDHMFLFSSMTSSNWSTVGLNIWLTKRLSNFLASVMWIQLSFSTTLMCFTSSLNL